MHANIGDRIVIGSHQVGRLRDGVVLEVRGTEGGPPYLVRWTQDGRETIFYPGPDATIEAAGESES